MKESKYAQYLLVSFLNNPYYYHPMRRILYCPKDNLFTLKEKCPTCDGTTVTTQPPKYSVDDKYADYRREAKKPARKEAGLL